MQHAVKADAREQQRDNGEEQRYCRQQPLPHCVRLIDLQLRADPAHTKFAASPRNFLPKDGRERARSDRRAHKQRCSGFLAWRPTCINRTKRNIELRQDRLTQIPVPDIPHQAHDLISQARTFVRREVERLTHRIYAFEINFRESLVDKR